MGGNNSTQTMSAANILTEMGNNSTQTMSAANILTEMGRRYEEGETHEERLPYHQHATNIINEMSKGGYQIDWASAPLGQRAAVNILTEMGNERQRTAGATIVQGATTGNVSFL